MAKQKVRQTRNKRIREDLIKILGKEYPLSAVELVPKLLEINSNRTVTVPQVSQILKQKYFEKAEVMPSLTATWKLKEE